MPTLPVSKELLFERLGRKYSIKELEEICFDFGLELEEETTDIEEGALLKIDIPANRYDLLCLEGISRALRIFLGLDKPPHYISQAPKSEENRIVVKEATKQVRPIIVGAILQNIKFTEANYASFIELQEKLHQNICRRRSLVAIGTHDLDHVKGPFTYDALSPDKIRFQPLNQKQEMNGRELMEFYQQNKHLSKYLHLIRDSPVYPVVKDADGKILSLPPIINSDHSKITLDTRNVLIECTAKDLAKAKIVLNTMCTMFSEYCNEKFCVEQLVVKFGDKETTFPDVRARHMKVDADYLAGMVGVPLAIPELVTHLRRMGLETEVPSDGTSERQRLLKVSVPVTRSDILHACDLAEDVAIAHGYNNIGRRFPSISTVGSAFRLNKLADLIRQEVALAGWTEVLTLILCSKADNYASLRRSEYHLERAVHVAHPKTSEYQIARTQLVSGMMKTLAHNLTFPVPLCLFEVGDVVLADEQEAVCARNVRRLCAVYCGKTSGFECVHGLLDRVMVAMDVPHLLAEDRLGCVAKHGYYLQETNGESHLFPGRQAHVMLVRNGDPEVKIGTLGIVHPEVLQAFAVGYPCSVLELDIEWFL